MLLRFPVYPLAGEEDADADESNYREPDTISRDYSEVADQAGAPVDEGKGVPRQARNSDQSDDGGKRHSDLSMFGFGTPQQSPLVSPTDSNMGFDLPDTAARVNIGTQESSIFDAEPGAAAAAGQPEPEPQPQPGRSPTPAMDTMLKNSIDLNLGFYHEQRDLYQTLPRADPATGTVTATATTTLQGVPIPTAARAPGADANAAYGVVAAAGSRPTLTADSGYNVPFNLAQGGAARADRPALEAGGYAAANASGDSMYYQPPVGDGGGGGGDEVYDNAALDAADSAGSTDDVYALATAPQATVVPPFNPTLDPTLQPVEQDVYGTPFLLKQPTGSAGRPVLAAEPTSAPQATVVPPFSPTLDPTLQPVEHDVYGTPFLLKQPTTGAKRPVLEANSLIQQRQIRNKEASAAMLAREVARLLQPGTEGEGEGEGEGGRAGRVQRPDSTCIYVGGRPLDANQPAAAQQQQQPHAAAPSTTDVDDIYGREIKPSAEYNTGAEPHVATLQHAEPRVADVYSEIPYAKKSSTVLVRQNVSVCDCRLAYLHVRCTPMGEGGHRTCR